MDNKKTVNHKWKITFSTTVLEGICSYPKLNSTAIINNNWQSRECTLSNPNLATLLTLIRKLCSMLLPLFMTLCKALMPQKILSSCYVPHDTSNIPTVLRYEKHDYVPGIQTIFLFLLILTFHKDDINSFIDDDKIVTAQPSLNLT